jgi:hypothetical protein
MARRLTSVAAALALLTAAGGCGGGGGGQASRSGTSALATRTPRAKPAPTKGLPAADQTCNGFVDHLQRVLANGLAAFSATGDLTLFAEFDGLSRRLGGVEVEPGHRAALDAMIAQLSKAADAVRTPRTGPPALSPPRQMAVVKAALARYNTTARGLGLRDCVISVRAAGP